MLQLKKLLSCLFWFLFFLDAEAQGPVAANGNFKTVDGIKIYYEISGKGKPLILMHTFFGTVEQWRNYTQELSKEFRVISIDLPGHGRSDCMDTGLIYDNTDAAKYIIGLLGQLGIDSAYFWGVSTGGTITLEMAVLKPQLVSKMVVLGAQLYYSVQTRNWLKKRGLQPADEDGIKDHGLKKANILEKQFYNYAFLYDELNITPDKLSTIKAKSLIVSGDDDVPAPFVSNALQMYQNIPGAYLWVVPGGGHLPHLDDSNHSEFLRRVTEFFSN